MSNEQQKAGSTKGVFTSPPHPLSPSLSVSLPLYLSLSLSISLSICLCLSPSSLVWNSHACATSRGCLSMHGAPRPQPWLLPSLCWAWQGTPSRGKGTSSGNQSPPKCIHSCVCVCACMRVAGVRQQLVWSGIGNQRVQTELKHTCDRDLTVACTSDDLNAPSTSSTASRYCSCATQKPQNQSKHSAHTDTQTVKT